MPGMIFNALKKKRSLEDKVKKIQEGDDELREDLIRSFKPFIAKTVASVCKRYINESDDEFSIGLIAFNDAINKYTAEKGRSLLAFAEILIKRRIIDYIRSQAKNGEIILGGLVRGEEQADSVHELDRAVEEYEQLNENEKRKEEIIKYEKRLKDYGLSFSDLAKHSPKHTDARQSAIRVAQLLVADEQLNGFLREKKRLPVKQLEEMAEVSRKTIERNRKYIIAISIIMNGGFLYLKDYVKGGIGD